MNDPQQVALVTGANKGIGFETARKLAQRGFVVWLGCRDEGRGVAAAKELAKDGDVRFVQLDVTDAASVKAAAARVERETGALDVLVNNAGIYVAKEDASASSTPLDAARRTFDVNYFGVLQVVQDFLPLVRRAKAGRIVMVSSSVGSLGALSESGNPLTSAPLFAYSSSKTALNAVTVWLSAELKDTAIKVNSVCPGYNATDLNDHAGTHHPSVGAQIVVDAATLDASGRTGSFFDASGDLRW